MPEYDVAIVGAGPSGSTTAYHLAKAGARVALIDRADFPREKPCGGGVTTRAFERAPIDLSPMVEHVITKVRFSYKLGGFFDYEYRPKGSSQPATLVYMTQRHRLDEYIMSQAREAGAGFHGGSPVRSVELGHNGVHVEVEGQSFDAEFR